MSEHPSRIMWVFAVLSSPEDQGWQHVFAALAQTEWGAKNIDSITLIVIGVIAREDDIFRQAAEFGVDSVVIVDIGPLFGRTSTLAEACRVLMTREKPVVSLFSGGPSSPMTAFVAAEWADHLHGSLVFPASSFRVMPDHTVQTIEDVEVGVTQAVRTFREDQPMVIVWDAPRVSLQRGRGLHKPLPEVERLPISVSPQDSEITVLRQIPPTPQERALEDADRVVAGGRGIGGADGFAILEQLASALDAGLGASRVAVDQGWVSYAHQVGQTGKRIQARLYMAFGISGAPQHMEGMRNCDTIIAVNSDPSAPIFEVAHLGVVGDAREVAQNLAAAIGQRRIGEMT
ncbi:MAG: hypothetical protein C7B46_13095 [Sulfobacillus benefaciens]|uniref:Electron transfer flavoprotein alpha subunit C-terminal domain-containing protein n=1 Tax=Sulfobacillus benefaciens TaxID=453960 RepID=A0A2T2XDV3_9FIRM|nr:MAG: hypothetical protein C7B46_13095 [Sulfobacillus benefaciens]